MPTAFWSSAEFRIGPSRLLIQFHRPVGLPGGQKPAQVKAGPDKVRLEIHGALELSDRVVAASLDRKGLAEIEVRRGKVGIEPQRRLKIGDCLAHLAHLEQASTDVVAQPRRFRRDGQCLVKMLKGDATL